MAGISSDPAALEPQIRLPGLTFGRCNAPLPRVFGCLFLPSCAICCPVWSPLVLAWHQQRVAQPPRVHNGVTWYCCTPRQTCSTQFCHSLLRSSCHQLGAIVCMSGDGGWPSCSTLTTFQLEAQSAHILQPAMLRFLAWASWGARQAALAVCAGVLARACTQQAAHLCDSFAHSLQQSKIKANLWFPPTYVPPIARCNRGSRAGVTPRCRACCVELDRAAS